MTENGRWNTITVDGNDTVFHNADVVFEGGGVKGIGLAYAVKAFEARGYVDWARVAGTSAGAIMAAYIACGGTGAGAVQMCLDTPWAGFQDWGAAHGLWEFHERHGLCRGDVFHRWMKKTLKQTVKQTTPAAYPADPNDPASPDVTFATVLDKNADPSQRWRLQMIATDVTRKKMLVLPDDLADFGDQNGDPIKPEEFPIADAVRMSMAIPYFYDPVHMTTAKHPAPGAAAPTVPPGTDCTIVDGGVLSNFPVWLFDTDPDSQPHHPTFGFFITGGKGFGSALGSLAHLGHWPVELAVDMFHTASGAWDDRFHSHSTVVRTCPVPVDGLGTTDFDKVAEFQKEVETSATKAANDFLDRFDLSQYRNGAGNHIAV